MGWKADDFLSTRRELRFEQGPLTPLEYDEWKSRFFICSDGMRDRSSRIKVLLSAAAYLLTIVSVKRVKFLDPATLKSLGI